MPGRNKGAPTASPLAPSTEPLRQVGPEDVGFISPPLPMKGDILPLQILFLDDEQDICDLFEDLFAAENIRIATFTDSLKALDSLSSQSYDLVFLDYRLNGANGIQVARQMDSQIPKILMSGDIQIAPDQAILKIIKKPFNIDEVKGLISYFVDSKICNKGNK